MPSRLTTAALALAAAAAVVPLSAAQAINQTYVTGLISGLNALNLTSTTAVLQTVAGTPAGQSLLAKLSSGTPYTVLIPDNDVSSPCCSMFLTRENLVPLLLLVLVLILNWVVCFFVRFRRGLVLRRYSMTIRLGSAKLLRIISWKGRLALTVSPLHLTVLLKLRC